MRKQARRTFRQGAAEHQEREVDARVADCEGILEAACREGERVAVVREGSGHRRRPVPVSVRLEGRDDLEIRPAQGAHLAHVVAQGREVDLHPVRADRFHRVFHRSFHLGSRVSRHAA